MDVTSTGERLKTGTVYINKECIQKVDENFCSLLGYDSEELVGQRFEILFQSAQDCKSFYDNCLPGLVENDSILLWSKLISKSQKENNVIINARYKRAYGINCGLVLTCITYPQFLHSSDKKIKELELKSDQKNKFIALLVHDLLGFVGTSINLIDYIKLKNNHKPYGSYLEKVFENLRNIHFLLETFIDWSKIILNMKEFKPSNVDVYSILNSTTQLCKILIEEKEINVKINCKKTCTIYSDQNMLEFVIRNLLTNAIKFSKQKSEIRIVAESAFNHLLLQITDFGVGIPKKKIGSLFNLNYDSVKDSTNKNEGAGLGLFLVHEFVKAHNGEIKIESEVGKGTKVYLEIPGQQCNSLNN